MNNNDKILINAYLDGETTDDETKYIEELIISDNDAYNYLNKLKVSNNDILGFFDSKDLDQISSGLDLFIQERLKENNFVNTLFSFLRTNSRPIGALSFVILFSLILFPIFNSNDFDIHTYNINIERSNESIQFEEVVRDTVFDMKKNSIDHAELIINKTSLIISIQSTTDNCVSGQIIRSENNQLRDFEYCED